MNLIRLTKESSENEIQRYFEKVRELHKSGEKFPVDFDLVWPLVYSAKNKAVTSLKSDFEQDIDYQSLDQTVEREIGASVRRVYKLTVRCMEIFIAQKSIPVMEVYRRVFHKVADNIEKQVSLDFTDPNVVLKLAQNWKEEYDKRLLLEARLEKAVDFYYEAKPKIEFFNAVADSKDAIEMSQAAKILNMGIGRNQLFEFLRSKKILRYNNEPYQKYIDLEYFRIVEQKYIKPDGSTNINIKTLVFQKGIDFIRKLYKNR